MTSFHLILEINTRVWLRRLGHGQPLSLANVPEEIVAGWETLGIDGIYLMGVWLPSAESVRIAREHEGLKADYSRALPDWQNSDVGGSPFAICSYEVNPDLGGNDALAVFRQQLAKHGIQLILDFIPNHTAIDHPWLNAHPDYYIQGTENDVAHDPANWFWVRTNDGPIAIAHGRDPNFPPWTDTAQLNYANDNLQAQMRTELARLATLCDGVRCDMAMLELSTVYEGVWKRTIEEFWPRAIEETKNIHPDFCFIAEVYWGMDEALRDLGFDVTYDKALLDEIIAGHPLRRERFFLLPEQHNRRLRFLENHDEPRIASQLTLEQHGAAAAWLLTLPGPHLIYDGQCEGRRVRLPVQLLREPDEDIHEDISERYTNLLSVIKREDFRQGRWELLTPTSAWTGNPTHENILAQAYDFNERHTRVFVNDSPARAQCWVRINLGALNGKEVLMQDRLSPKEFLRDGLELMVRGLYLDLQPWEAQIFDCIIRPAQAM